MKKDLGSMLALYPLPATLVGAMVDGKPTWLEVAHVGIIGHDRIMVSSMKSHFTNQGIRATGALTVSLVDEALLPRVAYVGAHSGKKVDKSGVFAWEASKNGAPVPVDAPLTLVCNVEDIYETETFDNFICSIAATLVDEDKLDDAGKPDYEKLAPVLFEFPTYSYLACGKKLGPCLSFKDAYQPEA